MGSTPQALDHSSMAHINHQNISQEWRIDSNGQDVILLSSTDHRIYYAWDSEEKLFLLK